MPKSPSPFIPAALDEADLTPHEFRVFCRICRRGKCTESVSNIAAAVKMHKDTVRAALKTLAKASMITKTPRPGTTTMYEARAPKEWNLTGLNGAADEADPSENEGGAHSDHPCENEGVPPNHPPENEGGDPSENEGGGVWENEGGVIKGYPIKGNPFEGANMVEKISTASLPPPHLKELGWIGWLHPGHEALRSVLPSDHPAVSERHLRYHIAARTSIDLLQQAEEAIESFRIPAAVRRKMQRDLPGLIRQYADVFRLIEEQDGYGWDEIQYAMNWLFTRSDWLRNGYIASMNSLRKLTSSGDQTKFESILTQAHADDGYQGPDEAAAVGSQSEREKQRREQSVDERFDSAYRTALSALRA